MATRDEIESSQGNAHSQKQAAKEPKCRVFGRNALADRPPETTEEDRTEPNASR